MTPYLDDGDVRPTLREHLETILNLSSRPAVTEAAEAALALLDSCGLHAGSPRSKDMRLVPDPQEASS